MKATSYKRITLFLCLVLLLALAAVGAIFGAGSTQASALTYTTPKYKTYGTTTEGTTTTSGSPSNFTIYMHGSSTSGTGTMYNDRLIDWSYVYIKIEVSAMSAHESFKLTKDGYTYSSKTLSGNSNMTLYSGSLSSGEYELTYIGNYKANLFAARRTFTYKYRFEVDKTNPSYTLKAGGSTISSGGYTNKQIVYTASDTNFDAIRYKKPTSSSYTTYYSTSYTVPATDANNGKWYFYARDDMDNTSTTVNVYLDTVKPVGKVTSNGTTIANGGYTNKPFSYTATDAGGVSKYEVKKAGSSVWTTYTSGTSLSGTNGWYYFRATDKAGNVSDEYKICYDTGTPTVALYSGTTSVSSGYYSAADYVKFTASDSVSGISSAYVKMPGNSYYSAYTSGSQLTAEGTYTFYAKDRSGNTSAYYTITLDKTKPTGTLYAGTNTVKSGTYTNASYIKFVPADSVSGVSATYVKKPDSSSYVSYTSGTQLTAVGTYSFYTRDKSGNQSDTYTITIDRSVPAAQLYADDTPVSNGSYTNAGHIKFECSDTNLKSCYVKLPDSETFVAYTSGTEYYKSGKYVFYAEDSAGLSTGEYTIVIDRTNKPLTFNNVTDGTTSGDVTITWTDGDADVFAPVESVTINGVPYAKGAIIHTIDTGAYHVVCTDAAGNVWTGDFTATTVNVPTQTLQQEYWEATDKDGNAYSFENYDNAFAFACEREKGYVRTGEWNNAAWDTGIPMDEKDAANAVNGTYFIYKKSGDPNTEVAYFTEARLNEVIAEYAAVGIESFYYWEKEISPIGEGQNLYRYSDGKTILANSIAFNEGVIYTVDGELVSGLVYDTEGVHELIVSDAYGNECIYTLIVVRDIPTLEYALGEGGKNTVTFDREYRLKDVVTVSIYDEFDEMAMFYVYDDEGNLLSVLKRDETYLLNESGKYIVQAVNHAGKSQEFILYLSLDDPKIEGAENAEDKTFEICVTDSADKYAGLQTLVIEKSTDGGKTWIVLTTDDYGKAISVDNLSYRFRTSGVYRVTLTDEFRTGIDAVIAQFTYEQPAPDGVLSGVENGGYTNTDITFTWTDEAIVTVKKDGEIVEYVSEQKLTENGSYEITFENYDGFSSTYSFVIDKTAPELGLKGVQNGSATNGDVTVSVPESGLTVQLYKDGELVGNYESGTPLTEEGSYRIAATDAAGNVTEVSFTIDKSVDFAADIYDNAIVNSMTFAAGENLTVSVTKDGEAVAYKFGDTLTAAGSYTTILTDELGNSKTFSFTIAEPLVQKFFHNFDNVSGLDKVSVNGEETRLNYGDLTLDKSGVYEIAVTVNGKDYIFTVTVDATAPAATLTGVENGGSTKGGVTLSDLTEKAAVEVYKDGEKIEYALGSELTEVGQYRIVLTDELGNSAEYTFEILYSVNGGAVALIVIAVLVVVGVIVTVVIMRKKGKFGKNKSEKNSEENKAE